MEAVTVEGRLLHPLPHTRPRAFSPLLLGDKTHRLLWAFLPA